MSDVLSMSGRAFRKLFMTLWYGSGHLIASGLQNGFTFRADSVLCRAREGSLVSVV